MKAKHNTGILYAASFFVPVLIFLIIMAINDLTPLGTDTFLEGDLNVQVVPFLSELSEKLKNGGSLFYSWKRGMGIDFLADAAYYLMSPLNIIIVFFNNKTLPAAISILIMLKCAFAGLTMSIYLKKHFYKNNEISINNLFILLAFSCSYALSAYMVNYYYLLMWLDCVVMLPLVILSLERLMDNDKPYLYSIYLGISIITNYYIGFMVCLFCVMYFAYLFIMSFDKNNKKNSLKSLLSFIKYSALGGGLSGFFIITQLYALSCTISTNSGFIDKLDTYYDLLTTFYRLMFTPFPNYQFTPYLYSGCIVFVLLPLYFTNKSFSLKERILKLAIIILLLMSFRYTAIEYIWNGFHSPNGYVGRNSFIFIFLVITICMESMIKFNKDRLRIMLSYTAVLILIFIMIQHFNFITIFKNIMKNLIVITLYLVLTVLICKHKKLSVILSIIIITEISYNFNYSLIPGKTMSSYTKTIDIFDSAAKDIDTNEFYRIKNDNKHDKNQGSLCNYNSIATVSSAANHNLLSFLSDLGYYCSLNACNDISWEPVFGSILGEKYLILPADIPEDDILKRVSSNDEYSIFENTKVLSGGFLTDNAVMDSETFKGNNPFERINSFAKTVADCGPIYEKANVYYNENEQYIFFDSSKDIYLYSKDSLKETEFISDKYNYPVYHSSFLTTTFRTDTYNDNYILHIAQSNDQGHIPVAENIKVSDIVCYSLNEKNFNKLMDILSANQIYIDKYTDTKIQSHINAEFDGTILTSIPYSKGWRVTVDGKKVKTSAIKDALLTFRVSKGKHIIEFKYLPPGIIPGTIVSIISLLLVIADIAKHIYQHKRSNYEKL